MAKVRKIRISGTGWKTTTHRTYYFFESIAKDQVTAAKNLCNRAWKFIPHVHTEIQNIEIILEDEAEPDRVNFKHMWDS